MPSSRAPPTRAPVAPLSSCARGQRHRRESTNNAQTTAPCLPWRHWPQRTLAGMRWSLNIPRTGLPWMGCSAARRIAAVTDACGNVSERVNQRGSTADLGQVDRSVIVREAATTWMSGDRSMLLPHSPMTHSALTAGARFFLVGATPMSSMSIGSGASRFACSMPSPSAKGAASSCSARESERSVVSHTNTPGLRPPPPLLRPPPPRALPPPRPWAP